MATTLRINLLGGFCLFCDGTPITALNTPRLQSLVTYLVLHRDLPQPRQHLAFLLWPDSTEAQARTNLRHLIHELRQALPCAADFLRADTGTLQWQPDSPFTLDVAEFERAHAAHDFDQAVKIYQGELLPDCYDDWIMPERERLQRIFSDAVEQVIRQHEEQRDYAGAIAAAQRLLRCEPLREEIYCDLMRLYALSGDRTGVARAYTMCAAVLRQELNIEPGLATQAAYTHYFEQPITSERSINSDRTPRANHRLSNLPCQLTRFIGREREKRDVKQRVLSQRLLTLVGAGGVGKTRLALAVAEDLINHFADGVWLVDLAPLSDPTLVMQTLAAVLSVREEGGGPLLVRLAEFVRDKQLLVVLDNCDHLTEAVRPVMATLLQAAPHLRVLATSRVVLGIEGEVTWRVPSFSVPDMTGWPVPAKSGAADASQHRDLLLNLRQYESVQFFVERASAVLPTFEVNDQTALAVGRICQQLDGIPLALELAAARVKLFTVHQITDRLGDALRLLTQGSPAALPRHQTLRATLDWSYALLTPAEQALFRRLSVFAGGATFEAVEGVCCGDGIEVEQGLDVLSGLVDKSLVAVEQSNAVNRFRLHEVARQYAAGKLAQLPVEETIVKDFHCAYYAEFLWQRQSPLSSKNEKLTLAEIEVEFENVRLAWSWAIAHVRIQELSHSLECLAEFYRIRGWNQEGEIAIAKAAQKLAGAERKNASRESRLVLGKLLFRHARFCMALSSLDRARQLLQESLEIFREQNALRDIAYALCYLGDLSIDLRESEFLWREGLAIFREIGDQWGIARSLRRLCSDAIQRGEYEIAQQLSQESFIISRELGIQSDIANSLRNLGVTAWALGKYLEAKRIHQEALALYQEIDSADGIANSLEVLAWDLCGLGEYDLAKLYLQRSLAIYTEIGRAVGAVEALGDLGEMANVTGEYAHAAQLAQESLAVGKKAKYYMGLGWQLRVLGNAACEQGNLREAREYLRQSLEQETTTLQVAQVLLTLVGIAALSVVEEKKEQALELLTLVVHHPATWQWARDRAAPLIAKIETELPPHVVMIARARGQNRNLDATVKDLLAELGS